jgi:hypothetical protein
MGVTPLLRSYGGSDSYRAPFPDSCPDRSPVFTFAPSARPTATNHTRRDAWTTMSWFMRIHRGYCRNGDFAFFSQARPRLTPNRVHLYCGRSDSYNAALHITSR